ncbi:FHA domain-containing protein [Massilia sp. B-10]|nr:FHA domain-containing protein [Massilia sp. B-10]
MHRHRVDTLPIRLGRGYDNDFIIDDAYAAPQHALIEGAKTANWCCATWAPRTA